MAMEGGGALTGRTLGGYQINSLLGVGGMAEVYRARDEALGRDVAVKVLPQALARDPGYVQRFRDEARRVAALDHPHIVPVYQFNGEGDPLFLVMPLLRESLRDRMIRVGTLPPLSAARIAVEIAQALDAAHTLGLVHRDVKPENVLLDADGKALLTDFGIARPEERLREAGVARTLAATGLPIGTPEYMAPEQLRAEPIDHRVDVYGLGAVVYELLTGAVPYDGATPYEVASKVLTAPLTPPSSHNARLWPELDAVITTALAKDPAERYFSVRGFAAALHRAIQRHDPAATGLVLPAGWAETELEGPSVRSRAAAFASVSGFDAGILEQPSAAAARWRERFQGRSVTDRRMPLALAAIVVLLIGICGGGGLALLGHLSSDAPGAALLSSLGASATDTSGAATPASTNTTSTGSVSNSTATIPVGAPPGTSGTPAPTRTVVPTGTAPPTPQPTATRTPTPTPLVLGLSSGNTFPINWADGYCTGQQTITNHNAMAVSWAWTSISPSIKNLYYTVGSSSGGGMPQSTTAPGATDTLTIYLPCSRNQTNAVTMSDAFGNTYAFTLQAQ